MPAELTIGGDGADGKLEVLTKSGTSLVQIDASEGQGGYAAKIRIGGAGVAELYGKPYDRAVLQLGGMGKVKGRIELFSPDSKNTVGLDGAGGIRAGGGGAHGTIAVRGNDGALQIELLGRRDQALIRAGMEGGRPGNVHLYDGKGQITIALGAANGVVRAGGGGVNGTVSVLDKDGQPLLELLGRDKEAVIGLGRSGGRPGRIDLYDGNGKNTIKLSAAEGDILLSNADCAEQFDVEGDVRPGSVMVLTEGGAARRSSEPYDTRIVGVVSGAGGLRPGLVLDRQETSRRRVPIALMGKVFCLVDATRSAVGVGDLLTTADRPGHAMHVGDADRALGAVLGKALAPLKQGTGLVPVLVTLR